MENKYQAIINKLIELGKTSTQLFAVIIIGSQARENHQADEYSDLDVIMLVDNPVKFALQDDWVKEIGAFNISFTEDSFSEGSSRRVLFENALDVDFILLCKNSFNPADEDFVLMLGRGYRVLVDKIGLKDNISSLDTQKLDCNIMTEHEFINLTNDFWYHSVWAAKKLKRGELWIAKSCVDNYMKQKLLSVIECHAQTTHGLEYDKWYSGRFVEEWAEKWIIEKLSSCFSHYNYDDIKAALLSTMDLFRLIAVDTAEKAHWAYPKAADDYATTYVVTVL